MNNRIFIALALSGAAFGSGCVGEPSSAPPIVPIRNMYQQPRVTAQKASDFYEDGRGMRPLVAGTVAQEMEPELSVQTGRMEDDSDWLLEIPSTVVERNGGLAALTERGQDRYEIYCAPCHASTGNGQGMVFRRAQQLAESNQSGAFAPTNLHDDRLRHIPDGQLYATITNGIRTMPAYGHNVPLDDRWSIVAYVRALQLSQAGRTPAANTEQNQ